MNRIMPVFGGVRPGIPPRPRDFRSNGYSPYGQRPHSML